MIRFNPSLDIVAQIRYRWVDGWSHASSVLPSNYSPRCTISRRDFRRTVGGTKVGTSVNLLLSNSGQESPSAHAVSAASTAIAKCMFGTKSSQVNPLHSNLFSLR